MFKYLLFAVLLQTHPALTENSEEIDDFNKFYFNNPRVYLANGDIIVGTVNRTIDQHKEYFAFRGIPYAKPPINQLRFRAPVPLTNSKSRTIFAFNDGSPCVQSGLDGTGASGSEDCLYLNVYTTQLTTKSSKLLPVMVWIFGNGYILGNGGYASFGPDFFLNEDVVMVTFNFRLGVFGYLSTGDLASPGNYAIKDQLLVLKWVNANIKYFGGDPHKVTVFGESGGAAVTGHLAQTPLTTGLMHRAILQSGSPINVWALSRHPLLVARRTAALLNIHEDSTYQLVKELKRVPAYDLVQAATAESFRFLNHTRNRGGFAFGPTIEPLHPGAVIIEKSFERLKHGQFHRIPFIIGFNSLEAVDLLDSSVKMNRIYASIPRINPLGIIPESLNIDNAEDELYAFLDIYNYYFGFYPTSFPDENLIQFNSDDLITRSVLEAAAIYSKSVPTYLYRFSYEGVLGSGNRTGGGVGHTEELPYFWRMDYDTAIPDPGDLETRHRVIKLWTSFAKHGIPTYENVDWKEADCAGPGNLVYLNIGKKLLRGINPEMQALSHWQMWFRQFGRPPYYTY